MIKNIFATLLLTFALSTAAPTLAAENIQAQNTAAESSHLTHVVLFVPADQGFPFWDKLAAISTLAADAFDIDLEVIYGLNNRFLNIQAAQSVSQRTENKPDYVLLNVYLNSAKSAMTALNNQGISFITINADVEPSERPKVGYPQGRFTGWLASVMPDDVTAGYLSADYLIDQARQQNLFASDGLLHIAGLSGGRDTLPSQQRERGLRSVLSEQADTTLKQMAYADWEQERASYLTSALLQRHPQVKAIWAASDMMALGAASAIRQRGLQPGKDILLAGTDWTAEGMQAIRSGELLASSGGHFLDVVLALAIIYDNEHGVKIAAEKADILRPMNLLTKDNIDLYWPVLNEDGWQKLNFLNLSRFYNKDLQEYPQDTFGLMDLLLQEQPGKTAVSDDSKPAE